MDDYYEKIDRIIDAHIKNLRQKIEDRYEKIKDNSNCLWSGVQTWNLIKEN